MTSQDIEKLVSTSATSQGGSRQVILLKNTAIKFPMKLSKLDIRGLSHQDIFEKARNGNSYDVYHSGNSEDEHIDSIDWLVQNGIEQTLAEWDIWNNCPEYLRHLLCPILEYGFTDTGIPYTIMEKAETFTTWGSNLGEICFEDFITEHFNFTPLEKNKLISEMILLSQMCHFEASDIFNNCSNVGKLNEKFVIIDYGWGHYNWLG